MRWFAIATLTPVALLSLAGVFGGVWCVLAFLYLTVFTHVVDRLTHKDAALQREDGEFPSGEALSETLGLAHIWLISLAIWAISGAGGGQAWEQFLCFASFGIFFGQISNANAHELIHKPSRWQRRLGKLVYISLMFGHHVSAHTRVHHVWVASDGDPNSARLGENFYRFWLRAWIGSFAKGWVAEDKAMRAAQHPRWMHPYVAYFGGALGMVWLAVELGGIRGVIALILVTGYAQMQLLLSDYVQHYGLRRKRGANGRLEPVGAQHSWNAPQFFSSATMLNAPRHSDHHTRPQRPYPALQLREEAMPMLPRSLPLMGLLALWPSKWRRVMDPRVARVATDRR